MGYISPAFIKSKIANRVDPTRAIAQAKAESDFDNFAVRYEPGVFKTLTKKGIPEKQAKLLSTSYGLFQIMGYNLKTQGIDVTQEGRAGIYLSSPTEQINSYVTFSQNLQNKYPDLRSFLAAYNGGDSSVTAIKTKGYYGAAEPYVHKVLTNMNAVTEADTARFYQYQNENEDDPGIILPVIVISAVLFGFKKWSQAS